MKPLVKEERLYKKVIQSMLDYIEEHQIKSGDRLPSERTLAEVLGVSRTTVKEAISVMEANGILHIRQGVGTFLAATYNKQMHSDIIDMLQNNNSHFLNLIELRQAIEGDIAFYAAKRATDKQKEKLTNAYQKLLAAEQAGEAAIKEDLDFHMAITEASNNDLLIEMMNLISERMRVFLVQNRPETLEEEEQIKMVMEEHQQIYHSIIMGNAEKAKQSMWDHLNSIKIRHHYERRD